MKEEAPTETHITIASIMAGLVMPRPPTPFTKSVRRPVISREPITTNMPVMKRKEFQSKSFTMLFAFFLPTIRDTKPAARPTGPGLRPK